MTASPFDFSKLAKALPKVPAIFADALLPPAVDNLLAHVSDAKPTAITQRHSLPTSVPSIQSIEDDLVSKVFNLSGKQVSRALFEGGVVNNIDVA